MRNLSKTLILSFVVLTLHSVNAQRNVGIGTSSPNQSAILEISSADKGILIPRLSLKSRNAISNPANGLLVYQLDNNNGFYFYNGNTWKPISENAANSVALDVANWSKTGDAGTTIANFIGTTDSQPFTFKVNGQFAGQLSNDNGKANTFYGYEGGINTISSTGSNNTVYGFEALKANTSGGFNIAIGRQALKNNNGDFNTAIGFQSGLANTVGSYNFSLGNYSLTKNTTGNFNMAIGTFAGADLEGSYNTAIGGSAGRYKNGTNNVYIGFAAGHNTTNTVVAENNALYIGNSVTANPLIKGDFSTGSLRINVKSQVGGSSILGSLSIGDFDAATSPQMTTPSGYRLVVQDGILTEKIKVALKTSGTDWADYVFEPAYKSKMLSLEEIEKFTLKNKHLPNVPSADDMVKTGLDVAQTSKMFMEKIEELTLYMIEMNKEIKALKAENQILKKK